MTKKKWLVIVISTAAVFLLIAGLLTYVVDPFFQFRSRDGQYMIHQTYCSPGLIKTYDYDTILIGSSMSQNFDMDLFRSELGCNPLKIGIGGMSEDDQVEYIQLANRIGKADTYYLCIDISGYAAHSSPKTIKYLMKDDPLSRIQYALSYESWFRFLPVDLAFTAVTKTGRPLPASYENRIKIDRLGYWGDQYEYGEDIVLEGRESGAFRVSDIDTEDLYNRMKAGIDDYFSKLDLTNANYIFYFPPYSSLFWADAQSLGYFDACLDAAEYFIERADEYGALVFDFQAEDFTKDLNIYRDTTHYIPEINDLMTKCFASGENIVTPSNYALHKEKIIQNTEEFKNDYSFLFAP